MVLDVAGSSPVFLPKSMSWRDLFGGKRPAPPAEHQNCSFCSKPRIEVYYLVAGRGVSICDQCVVLAAAVMDETLPKKHGVRAAVLAEMAATCPPDDEPRLLETLTRAAIGLMADDHKAMRDLVRRLMQQPTSAVRGRAVLLISNAIGDARDSSDCEQMIVAALMAGELEIAAHVTPPPSDHPVRIALTALAPLVRARPGDAIESLAADLRRASSTLAADAPVPERATIDTTLALAELRCGRPAGAVAHYAKYDNLQPWHDLARGDAMMEIGDAEGATAAWQRVAADAAYPYWVEEATRRLATRDPYR